MSKQELRIRLNANSSTAVEAAAKDVVKMAQKVGCKVSGPIPLPTNIFKITVNKSPHVNKKSREQFEIRDLSRLIIVHYPSPELIKEIGDFHLPPGVAFKILSDRKNTDNTSAKKSDLDKQNNTKKEEKKDSAVKKGEGDDTVIKEEVVKKVDKKLDNKTTVKKNTPKKKVDHTSKTSDDKSDKKSIKAGTKKKTEAIEKNSKASKVSKDNTTKKDKK